MNSNKNVDEFNSKPFVWVKTNKNEYSKMRLVIKTCLAASSLVFDFESESLKILESKDIIFSEDEYNLLKSISEIT